MSDKYLFYYDESGHSRKLTEETVTADNYDDFFISCIIGFSEEDKSDIEANYQLFEDKYKKVYQVEELKSTVLSNKKYKFGFKSFKEDDLNFINDYLDLVIKHNLLIYVSVLNKFEYLVDQLLRDYRNNINLDADAIRYTVTKAISVYRPQNVITSMYDGKAFSQKLRDFLEERININGDIKLKELENYAFKEAYLLIDVNREVSILDWDYAPPFMGFSYYLKEHHIDTDEIIIDREGSGKTLKAAIKCGFVESYERDSKEEIGIRIADILAGLLNGFIGSILKSTKYDITKEPTKKLIDNKWFFLNDPQIECYKKLQKVVIEQNESWYKTYTSYYSDPFLFLICLLNYINQKDKDYLVKHANVNNEYLNTFVCLCLEDRFSTLRSKLKTEPVVTKDNDYFINQRGAKEYLDKKNRRMFALNEGESKRTYVLNAGIFYPTNTPTMTIDTEDGPIAYDLPQELYGWVLALVGYANTGSNLLPEYVVFTKKDGKYYADIE